ncbi:MAG TPA: PadR family transcriptional regulator, partial [Candidatus Bathyarchaeia archaeon]|nr:PadR family transcriptional regulator [Candidatus Bathyarchaeia archaeon]
GLLRYYILHKIAQKPIHGYEIIQDIDSKTEGAWRPGAGSLYPILKKLVSEGLIKADPELSNEATRRVYQITPKGVESLAHAKEMFANFQQRFGSLRRLFIELIDPENLATFFVDGSNRQFQMAQEMLESKQNKISPADLDYILKEYTLNLERQMNWANRMLNRSKSKASPTPRQKVAKAR